MADRDVSSEGCAPHSEMSGKLFGLLHPAFGHPTSGPLQRGRVAAHVEMSETFKRFELDRASHAFERCGTLFGLSKRNDLIVAAVNDVGGNPRQTFERLVGRSSHHDRRGEEV